MDDVDSPYLRKKNQPRADPMLSEIKARLRQRKKDGLTYGISDESDNIIEDDDGESDDDIMEQYRMDPSRQRVSNRPGSAKRRSAYQDRSELSLGDTMKPGSGNRFMKQTSGFSESMPPVSPKGRTTSPGSMPSIGSPKASPKDSKSMDSLLGKRTPSPKTFGTELTKEEIIFGRKTSPHDQRLPYGKDNKPWQPPQFDKVTTESLDNRTSPSMQRKTPLIDQQGRKTPTLDQAGRKTPTLEQPGRKTPTLDYAGRRTPTKEQGSGKMPSFEQPGRKTPSLEQQQGRKTPSQEQQGRRTPSHDQMLQPLNQSGSSRFQRRQSPGADRKISPRSLSIEDSPRSESAPRPRPRHKTDIFGKTDAVEVDLEEDSPAAYRLQRSASGRKTPTSLSGKKSPPGKELSGRKTPTGLKSPGPTGRKSPSPFMKKDTLKEEQEKKGDQKVAKREASLLDFLTEDVDSKKEKKRPSLLGQSGSGRFNDQESNLRDSHISEPEQRSYTKRYQMTPKDTKEEEVSIKRPVPERRKKTIPDDSSLCEEFETDPYGRSFSAKEDDTQTKTYKSDKTESKKNLDIIDKVALEQDKPGSMKHIDPSKSTKKSETVHKPKPRHTLPGMPPGSTTVSEMNFNDTMSIRQAVYDEWYQERLKSAREKKKEEKKKQEEEEKKKQEAKKEKKIENECSYKAWAEKKKEEGVKKKTEKEKEEKKKEKEEMEKTKKKQDAEKNFELWKSEKDVRIQEEKRKKEREERRKEREIEEKKLQKEKENSTALRGWNRKKDTEIKKKEKEKKNTFKETLRQEDRKKEEREEEAEKLYRDWLIRKEEQKKREKSRKYGSLEDIEYRPAWSPASKTIPFGR